MVTIHRVTIALLLSAWLVVGCADSTIPPDAVPETPAAPVIVIPVAVVSSRTADQVAKMILDALGANERKHGPALAPALIVRIQLVRAGEMFELKHFGGTNPGGSGMSPDGGPGWMVEAVGTFIGEDRRTGQIDSLGMHGFHLWDDAGGEGWGFIACRTRMPQPAAEMEGVC